MWVQPDPRIYLRALELLDLPPDEACMVAAHAYDLRAAAKVFVHCLGRIRRRTYFFLRGAIQRD